MRKHRGRAGPGVGPDLVSGRSGCRAVQGVGLFRGSGPKDETASRKVRPYHGKKQGRAASEVGLHRRRRRFPAQKRPLMPAVTVTKLMVVRRVRSLKPTYQRWGSLRMLEALSVNPKLGRYW